MSKKPTLTNDLGKAQAEYEAAEAHFKSMTTKLRNTERAWDEAKARLVKADEVLVSTVRAVRS